VHPLVVTGLAGKEFSEALAFASSEYFEFRRTTFFNKKRSRG
jgi:hypothetical protein